MAAATLRPQMTAGTEHGQEALLPQSTAMSANVAFINGVAVDMIIVHAPSGTTNPEGAIRETCFPKR